MLLLIVKLIIFLLGLKECVIASNTAENGHNWNQILKKLLIGAI